MSEELKEGVKEIIRTSMMAVIPLAIIQLQSGSVDYKLLLVAGLIALLSGIDKFLHKKETGIFGNGLTVI